MPLGLSCYLTRNDLDGVFNTLKLFCDILHLLSVIIILALQSTSEQIYHQSAKISTLCYDMLSPLRIVCYCFHTGKSKRSIAAPDETYLEAGTGY